jgi:hypothetical protein
MKDITPGLWHVREMNGAVGVFSGETPVALALSQGGQALDTQRANADLMAAAPLLLEVCNRLHKMLENSFIVTPEGFKINDSELRELLLDAILRAKGYRTNSPAPSSRETPSPTPGTNDEALNRWLLDEEEEPAPGK